MGKQEDIDHFNQVAEEWTEQIRERNYKVAEKMINKLEIEEGSSVLDIAAGTGILYSKLKDKNLSNYVAIDIAKKMVAEFLAVYPEADVRCKDFETELQLESNFDFVLLFNSIPHFYDLDMVFKNVYNNLNQGGKFAIIHSTTRKELKEHHRQHGYESAREEPIPKNEVLFKLAKKYKFSKAEIKDSDYFIFNCEKT